MHPLIKKRTLKLNEINFEIKNDAKGFIESENKRYYDEIRNLVEFLKHDITGHILILLSGPSSAGKTTTALTLMDYLRNDGVESHTVSLDNFYRGRGEAPLLDNGTFDYESLEALDLEKLEQSMRELLADGRTMLPKFDFENGRRIDNVTELKINKKSVVIFEGIHTINPFFEERLPSESIYKLFINTVTPIYNKNMKLMSRRDIRLVRRLVRDKRFRGSSYENTLSMWQQVVRGEKKYMFPYVDTVDYLIDTTHAYEPCVFAKLFLSDIEKIDTNGVPFSDRIIKISNSLKKFEQCSIDIIPENTLLREFIG